MELKQVYPELVRALHDAGLDADRLEPWPAWKAFKSWLRRQLGAIGGFDNGSVIALVRQDSTGALSGTWQISCYACDGAVGTIVLRRKP